MERQDRMGQDHIRYDILAQDALRGVIRKVLSEVAATGRLPGDHHFFITFLTGAPGVRISQHLKSKYPEQMTIVVQHQFWELGVTDQSFEVGLSFSGVPERLFVPLEALTGFFDPSVRPYFEAELLSFTIPMSRFKEMYHTMRESCLFDTHAWGKIKERIQLSQSRDVHILPSPISFPILPDIYLQEIRMEDAAAIYYAIDTHRDYLRTWLPFVDNMRTTADEEA